VIESQASAKSTAADPSLAEALDLVEARLAERLRSDEPRLTEIAAYLVQSGGKRIRPTVTLVIYRACGGTELADIVDVAAALELIHSATLLHDDIIDHSETRRGKDSAYRKYGLGDTLVTGDFVFSKAFQLCARFEERLINWAAEACIKLTEGEVMQARFRKNPEVTVDDYRQIIYRKTASIFEQGARTAAYLAGAPERTVAAMAQCGADVGMTFQIVDDLLDVEGDAERTGKPVGLDLREGNPGLPIVLAMAKNPEVARVFRMQAPSDADVASAIAAIRACGVLEEARAMALEYGHRAHACIAALAPSADRDQLLAMVDQLIERAS
jgi:geranylgeranyl pyrophosphate synthase